MSSAAQILRQRTRDNRRPIGRRTKTDYADVMRAAALSSLNAAYCNDEMRDNANTMLEIVGDMLTAPRAGWYPAKPRTWRA